MFRALAILASIAGASAFAPVARVARASSLKMGYESEIGVIKPTGFFDPFGLSKNIDSATFAKYRLAELKHGRVCQLAVLGYVVPEVYRWPGEIAPGVSFESIPNGLAAIEAIPALGWFQMIFLIGFVDYRFTLFGAASPFTAPAYTFAAGPLGQAPETQEEADARSTQELQHGRLAMVAMLELFRHDSQQLVGGMYQDDAIMSPLITGLPFLYGN